MDVHRNDLQRRLNRLPRLHSPPAKYNALAAAAVGAVAVGAFAIGALAIGRLVIGRARIRSLRINELRVGRLTIDEQPGRQLPHPVDRPVSSVPPT